MQTLKTFNNALSANKMSEEGSHPKPSHDGYHHRIDKGLH